MFKKIARFFRANLIAGILVILPAILTILIVRFLVGRLNQVMLNPLLLKLSPYMLHEEQRLVFAKAAIFISVILLIVFIGLMTRILIIRRVFSFFERFLYKLPMVNKIYGTTKQISQAFLGSKKSSFQKVVLVEYPRKGIYTLGFVTSKSAGGISELIGEKSSLLNVYIPTTPNPTSGLFVFLKEEDVITLDITVEEALKMVVSAGAITPLYREKM